MCTCSTTVWCAEVWSFTFFSFFKLTQTQKSKWTKRSSAICSTSLNKTPVKTNWICGTPSTHPAWRQNYFPVSRRTGRTSKCRLRCCHCHVLFGQALPQFSHAANLLQQREMVLWALFSCSTQVPKGFCICYPWMVLRYLTSLKHFYKRN